MRTMVMAAALCLTGLAARAETPVAMPDGMDEAQVIFLGEVHDNGEAHEMQAAMVAAIEPRALVFEMLTEEQAAKAVPELIGDEAALGDALDWAESGWPDFAMYYPIFAAAPEARIYGAAVPREAARAAMEAGVAETFGPDAAAYGLTVALSEEEQAAREQYQHEAHCEALPAEMLPVMVDIQRLRDASLARAAARALEEVGAPVVVIAGNGHVRRDWGAPRDLQRVSDAAIFALGIVEGEAALDRFDAVGIVSPAERDDPCAAFSGE